MDVDVRPLASREASRAAALETRAFAPDPVITHYLWEPRRRRWAYPAFFRMALEEPLANGTAFAAEVGGELRAVAAWLPPQAGRPGALERARARAYGAWVRVLFPRTTASPQDPLDRRGLFGVTQHAVAVEGADRGQAGVASPSAAPAIGFEMVQERADQRRVELAEIEPRWLDPRACRMRR